MTRTDKNWGYELLIHNGGYCMKLLVYEKPIASSLHYHERKHECFYVADGEFEIEVNEHQPYRAKAGYWVVLAPGTLHRIRCIKTGIIVEASSHDDPDDCVRLIPSEVA
jgi:quercetin dioxygenase-like cupin family protein